MNLVENLVQTGCEEGGEIAQAFSKINRFGPDSINPKTERKAVDDLIWEINDLLAVIEMLKDRGMVLEGIGDPGAVGAAKVKLVKALEASQKAGLLTLPDETDAPATTAAATGEEEPGEEEEEEQEESEEPEEEEEEVEE